jgi:hypothetical protein
MTVIRPEGIWQSVDFRIRRGDAIDTDSAPKQLSILCPPMPGGPHVLLGFTGLAETPDGTPMLQWIRETVRGEGRFIMPLLDHLRDRLTRDVGRSRLGRHGLVVTGGIFQGDGRRFYFEINNFDPVTRQPRPKFERGVIEVTEPSVFLGGSGQRAAEPEKDFVLSQLKACPPDWRDYLALLAAVNRRAAERNKGLDPKGIGTVSPWCQASYLGTDHEGVESRIFTEPGDPPLEFRMEAVIAGIDFADSMKVFMARARGEALRDEDMEMAIRRGLKGRS